MTELAGPIFMLPLLAALLLQPGLDQRPAWVRALYLAAMLGSLSLIAASLLFDFAIPLPLPRAAGNLVNIAGSVAVVVLSLFVLLRNGRSGAWSVREPLGPEPHRDRA